MRCISSGRADLISSSPKTTGPGSLPRHDVIVLSMLYRFHASQPELKRSDLFRTFSEFKF